MVYEFHFNKRKEKRKVKKKACDMQHRKHAYKIS